MSQEESNWERLLGCSSLHSVFLGLCGEGVSLYVFFVGLSYFELINNNNWRKKKKEKTKTSSCF